MPISCYAVPNPAFQPAMRIVIAISQSSPATITTSFNHQYVDGIIVRLDIPLENGMQQLVGAASLPLTFPITVTGLDTFTVPVDSTSFQAYTDNECCMVVPVGQLTGQLNASTRNVLPYPFTP